jgi:F0F1-type ATP synthase assembly protein I
MRQGSDGKNRTGVEMIGRLSGIILILPGAMAAGWILGYYVLDRYLHTSPWGGIVLTLMGGGAGFYEIVKLLVPGNGDGDRNRRE